MAVLDLEPIVENKNKTIPPYGIIVYNDNDHTFDYVIEGLIKVCKHSVQKAEQLAIEIHKNGKALVWSGSKELAELKDEQLRSLGIDNYGSKPVKYPLKTTIVPI